MARAVSLPCNALHSRRHVGRLESNRMDSTPQAPSHDAPDETIPIKHRNRTQVSPRNDWAVVTVVVPQAGPSPVARDETWPYAGACGLGSLSACDGASVRASSRMPDCSGSKGLMAALSNHVSIATSLQSQSLMTHSRNRLRSIIT